MGGGVGLTIGFIFGSYSILRYVYWPQKKALVLRKALTTGVIQTRCRSTGYPGYAVAIHAE